jgi:tRNA (guanine37-N1)-methyltransferase
MADAISRNVKGVLGNQDSLEDESYNDISPINEALLEAPSFCKPTSFKGLEVPSEYLKGNHANIRNLKKKLSICKTKYYRP